MLDDKRHIGKFMFGFDIESFLNSNSGKIIFQINNVQHKYN